MTLIPASASFGAQHQDVLSADNCRPDRFQLIEHLRRAAGLLGLRPPVLATLEVLLSCLPPQRKHDVVFAANATLTHRRAGITDRTLRRHIAQLHDSGLLHRIDSPNCKRFTRSDPLTGQTLRFGFDLAPLFARCMEISELAGRAAQEAEHLRFLKMKLRSAVHHAKDRPEMAMACTEASRGLRRRLDEAQLQALLRAFPDVPTTEADTTDNCATSPLTATNGQNVRHLHKSKKETYDSDLKVHSPSTDHRKAGQGVSVAMLLAACPDAAEFSIDPVKTVQDVIRHSRTIAPMMGITPQCYERAEQRIGVIEAAVTVWAVLQIKDRVRKIAAYFAALTNGTQGAGFDAWALVRRLALQQARNSPA